ncbi:MAG: hypothetical protein HN961_02425 [Planctomycetes bacterium]|nr:hypothetical protein [Planctomycetota bacterium]
MALATLLLVALPQIAGGGLDKVHTWRGENSYDQMGSNVAVVGDVDGDGVGDILGGAPGFDSTTVDNVGMVRLYSGATGAVIYEFTGVTLSERIGIALLATGDANGDGIPDFAYSDSLDDGHVYLISGADGSLLKTYSGPIEGKEFGAALDLIQDLNADGWPELLIGDPNFSGQDALGNTLLAAGVARVVDGASGAFLMEWVGETIYEYMGGSVCCPGDLDLDGSLDYIIGAAGADLLNLPDCGSAFVRSGSTGYLMTRLNGESYSEFFPQDIAGTGDINGDGSPDFLISSEMGLDVAGDKVGYVRLISGNPADNGAELRRWEGSVAYEHLGSSLASTSDFDEDGTVDFLFGADGDPFGGRVYLHSGATGERLWIFESEGWTAVLGSDVADAGDINGDGSFNVVLGSSHATDAGAKKGALYLYSFGAMIEASANWVSLSSGGTVNWSLDFPPDYVHEYDRLFYALLASDSVGMTRAYGWQIPLAAGSVLTSTMNGHYPSVVQNGTGQLDINGDATITAIFPAGMPPGLAGRTYALSAASYELTTWGEFMLHGITRPATLELVP